jgi:predicted AlkP superfamily pyrophosphatase or phosphodiesterase
MNQTSDANSHSFSTQPSTHLPNVKTKARPTAVINLVGLSGSLLGEHTPRIVEFGKRTGIHRISPVLPALTCSTQSTYLTGLRPSEHGVVGNGWYFKDLAQVWLWRQSNHLVSGAKLWDLARQRDPEFTCANLFWWFNMASSVDYAVTPRPVYRSDGLKLPDIHTHPIGLRDSLQKALGPFPLFNFWGPAADLRSSQWIAEAAKRVYLEFRPTLNLVYLPHLDYCLQKEGPTGATVPKELKEIDQLCGELIDFYLDHGVRVVLLSEYGIGEVSSPIAINRILREYGLLAVREECGEDHFDPAESRAFAVADHQIAHVYVQSPADRMMVRELLEKIPGIESILDEPAQATAGIGHPRSGDFVLVAKPTRWFSYYYWLDDRRAPDFARTVDIHRKPGYDPAELFLDPSLKLPKLRIARRLAEKALGFRYTMDVTPLKGDLVRGSHGSPSVDPCLYPVWASSHPTPRLTQTLAQNPLLDPTQVQALLLAELFEELPV